MSQSGYNPASPITAVPFPLIVSVLGVDTTLGQALFVDLLHSPRVDKVHAVAFDDFSLHHTLPAPTLRKARIYITSLTKSDRLGRQLSRIPECDIAFCVLSSERRGSTSMSKQAFRAMNYHAPTQFIRRMFALGVLHISVLSHIKADHDSASDFYALKADVEKYVRAIRREAGQYSPIISVFRMPSHIMAAPMDSEISVRTGKVLNDNNHTNVNQQQHELQQNIINVDGDSSFASFSGIHPSSSRSHMERSQSFRDPTRRHALKGDPQLNSKHVQVKDVAAAMQIDAFFKASTKAPPGEQKKRSLLQVFDAEGVQRILEEVEDYDGSQFAPN